ncbi:MAG: pseudaminic acid cytidylyltransferase [Bacteroidales bacterium]|jgi:pseudaminic acid cytidylyltransferase|nr:pseudaminic acid cytidylyltransferase [Bacteroidales bacterium]MDD3151443.1 pseudaminic acid cytidylyltransferase [Bacteroidales bacterium]MDD3914422.1 pseudaminic acid cytidylyltransferase [Bacteroidales bacterium]MDD4634603.1 pseudaminic acid cytidylyltransferase [Bacteroidales bacterium]
MKNLAIIPARGGSKRIPRKNIKPFLGKPIMAYSIEAAIESHLFDEVMVSTDDDEFAEIAQQHGANVPFMRSEKTANDFASTADVIFEVLDNYASFGKYFDFVTCIYSTAPFVTATRLKEAFDKLQNGNFDAVFTAVAYSYPIQRSLKIENDRISMLYPEYLTARSQDLQTIYHDAGQFYMATVEAFKEAKSFWGKNTGGLILSELEVQDLDTETDWKLAEMKYKLLHG